MIIVVLDDKEVGGVLLLKSEDKVGCNTVSRAVQRGFTAIVRKVEDSEYPAFIEGLKKDNRNR